MRKITLFIMTLMMAGSLFAYEPKKENATVKRNGDIEYYEKTEVWNIYGWNPETSDEKLNQDYVKWVIREDYTIKQLVDYHYKRLVSLRPHTNEYGIWVEATGGLAESHKKTAIISIPFVTEENYLYLTKTQMLIKMYAFIEECTK